MVTDGPCLEKQGGHEMVGKRRIYMDIGWTPSTRGQNVFNNFR